MVSGGRGGVEDDNDINDDDDDDCDSDNDSVCPVASTFT